ncbi:MAG: NAD(P)-dependent oxidoreductase [Bacteroidota bacterium]
MNTKLNILVAETQNFSPEAVKGLEQLGNVTLRNIEKENLTDALAAFDVFWFRLKFKIEEKDFPPQFRCRYILCPVTGLDHIDLAACEKRGIKVLALRGETEFLKTVRATAEHTLGLTLSLLRHVPQAVHSVNEGVWSRDLFKGHEIFGKKVGILGVGRLGTITAGFFKAFGAEVYGYDVKNYDASVCNKVSTLEELFAISDILSIHVAYNESTHHLINTSLLKKMKSSAVLINTARGGVVKSEDLVAALQNKIIAGAALDVIEDEYNTANNVLINYAKQHDNLIITPHIGGNTYESFAKTELFLLEKLKKALQLDLQQV